MIWQRSSDESLAAADRHSAAESRHSAFHFHTFDGETKKLKNSRYLSLLYSGRAASSRYRRVKSFEKNSLNARIRIDITILPIHPLYKWYYAYQDQLSVVISFYDHESRVNHLPNDYSTRTEQWRRLTLWLSTQASLYRTRWQTSVLSFLFFFFPVVFFLFHLVLFSIHFTQPL